MATGGGEEDTTWGRPGGLNPSSQVSKQGGRGLGVLLRHLGLQDDLYRLDAWKVKCLVHIKDSIKGPLDGFYSRERSSESPAVSLVFSFCIGFPDKSRVSPPICAPVLSGRLMGIPPASPARPSLRGTGPPLLTSSQPTAWDLPPRPQSWSSPAQLTGPLPLLSFRFCLPPRCPGPNSVLTQAQD